MTNYTVPHSLPVIEPAIDPIRSATGDNLWKQINALAASTNNAISAEGGRAEEAAKEYSNAELGKDRARLGGLEATAATQGRSITTLDDRSFTQGRSITTLDQRSIAQGERVNAIETVSIPGAVNAAKTYADGEIGKDRTRLAGLETIAVPKALADAKTYADAEVTKDRIRLTQAEAADVKQNADIRETLRAALAYADGKAADINRVLNTSHIGLDTDGTPYYRPGSTTVKVQQDTDGTPFYEAA